MKSVFPICEICGSITNKKAFQGQLLWKAFNTRNIAFSGQLELLRNNHDNRNVYDIVHSKASPSIGPLGPVLNFLFW